MDKVIDIFKNIKRNKYTTMVGLVILAQSMYLFHKSVIGMTDYLIGIGASLLLIFYAPSNEKDNQKQNQ